MGSIRGGLLWNHSGYDQFSCQASNIRSHLQKRQAFQKLQAFPCRVGVTSACLVYNEL